MNTADNSIRDVEDAFGLLSSSLALEFPRRSVSGSLGNLNETKEMFSLKEVVIAVTTFLKNIVSKHKKIEVSNLCGDDVPVVGNKSLLQNMIGNAVKSVEESFKNEIGIISVIIHDLKRAADAVLLPKGDEYCDASISEKEIIDNKVRSKYVAVSVLRKAKSFGGVTPRTSTTDEKAEVTYCDMGVIVKKTPSNIVIYLARFAT